MSGETYVRIQVDESFLDKVFKQIEDRLEQHEQWIIDLQNLLRDKADRSETREIFEILRKDLDSRLSETNNRFRALESQFEGAVRELETHMNDRLTDMKTSFDDKLRDQITTLEAKIPENDPRIPLLMDRMGKCEGSIDSTAKKMHLTRDSVQQIASSIASLNKTQAALDSTLPEVLKGSVGYVNHNFAEIFGELEKIREREQFMSVVGPGFDSDEVIQSRSDGAEGTGEYAVAPPGDSGGPGQVRVEKGGDSHQTTIEKKTIVRRVGGGTTIDLRDISPYPAVTVHWQDPPDLPTVRKYQRIEEVVDFIYRLMPKLQALLNAFHVKIDELNTEVVEKIDRSLVERMFDRFQGVIGEIKTRFEELKVAVEQTASRDEINQMVEDLFHALNVDNETAIGRVKCIACGRDTTRVTGALTEGEVARALGNAPNSIAFHVPTSPQPIGVFYASKEGFDGVITESPRSVRPHRSIQVRPKVKAPAVPPLG
jgi:predicted nuclease with TOPRIM domain